MAAHDVFCVRGLAVRPVVTCLLGPGPVVSLGYHEATETVALEMCRVASKSRVANWVSVSSFSWANALAVQFFYDPSLGA